MNAIAVMLSLRLLVPPEAAPPPPESAPPPTESEAPPEESEAPPTQSEAPPTQSEAEPEAIESPEPEATKPPAPAVPEPRTATVADEPPSTRTRPDGHKLVVGGVALVCTSLVGYVAMIVGLGIGSGAESRIASLYAAEDIERRRQLIERGTMGNRLAIGAGVTAAVLMATGIALIVVGRRRAQVGVGSLRVRF